MWLPCSRARAIFALQGIEMESAAPGEMQWDEHGGTFVLRVGGLEVTPVAEPAPASGIWLEVALPLPAPLLPAIREFAGRRLPLTLSPRRRRIAEPYSGAARPGQNLFIYCEEPQLHLRAGRHWADGNQGLQASGANRGPTWCAPGPGRTRLLSYVAYCDP
jgi:hypothetical protein